MSEQHRTHKKRKKHKSRSTSPEPAEQRLLRYAAVGHTRKAKKLLKSHGEGLNIDAFDTYGNTALHHACQQGHHDIIQLLLKRGASVRSEDFRGNTPAHLAAAAGQLPALALLLQAHPELDVEKRNSAGLTIQELADTAMGEDDRASMERDPEPEGPREAEPDPERDWGERLRDAAAEDGFWDYTEYDEFEEYGGEWGTAAEAETEEEFARRIWQEMQEKRRRQAAAAGASVAEEFREQKRRRAEAEGEAFARSQRILEEERAKDAAWRQAVLQGDLGSQRAKYEARWHTFVSSATASITYSDVPWMVEGSADKIRAVVLYGTTGPEEERKRLRLELMRWHPDKFVSRFGRRLHPADKPRILAHVNEISQQLTGLAAS